MKIIKKLIIWLLLIPTILLVSLGIYTTYIERNLLVSKKHNIIINENGETDLKIVHFTDTQLGDFYTLENLEKAVNKINKLKADVVVFTGDLIDHAADYEDLDKVEGALSKIEAKIGKYAVYGNHDIGGGAIKYYEDIMTKSGFITLENQKASIEVDGKIINFYGADDALMGIHNADETMRGVVEDEVNILLIHEPDLIDEYNEYPIDLALSGHSHGGQVYIPFYGPIKKNYLAEKYNKGFYTLDNERKTKIYVNTGLGNTKVPFRLFNIPQISLFKLKI
ncbi:metallophosphoesterase [Clostridium sp.]|uniref:metallophosphoesterase n=1 Tax=Clostridium sp. TaxID=1506 RepID=UPI003F339D39